MNNFLGIAIKGILYYAIDDEIRSIQYLGLIILFFSKVNNDGLNALMLYLFLKITW